MQSNQAQGTLVTVLMPFDIVPLVGRFPLPVKTGKAYATNVPPAHSLHAAGSPACARMGNGMALLCHIL